VLAIDLEQYSWQGASLIRPTEGTVLERLPLRMEVRRGAALETSHVLLLIDDEEDAIFSGLAARAKTREKLYETPLMLGSGVVSGWFLGEEADWAFLAGKLEALTGTASERYGKQQEKFLYAVGDGNHSLASAKAVWEEYKTAHAGAPGLMDHPARWALVELENLYDPGIRFEPIHRLVFGVDMADVLQALSALPRFTSRPVADQETLAALVGDAGAARMRLGLVAGRTFILAESDAPGFATDSVQPLLDDIVKSRLSIDYIHGEDALFRGCAEKGGVGLLLPPVRKAGLFEMVARRGPLPRKSFSMGEAEEKRFYLEVRRLF
jgi:hypothetical protein